MKRQTRYNTIVLIFLSILFVLIFFKTFHNVYVIQRNDYVKRLINNYGYCDKQGYGFVRSIINKHRIKDNVNIINNFNSLSSINALFYNFDKNYDENYLILLNYNNNSNNSSIIIFNNSEYKILDSYENKCFLLKKNND